MTDREPVRLGLDDGDGGALGRYTDSHGPSHRSRQGAGPAVCGGYRTVAGWLDSAARPGVRHSTLVSK